LKPTQRDRSLGPIGNGDLAHDDLRPPQIVNELRLGTCDERRADRETERPRMRDDRSSEVQSLAFILPQGRGKIIGVRQQRIDQSHRVACCFGNAQADMRTSDKRRVPHQYRAAEYKLRSLGLHMGVREERFSTGAPYGSVLEQDIEAGATIKRGRTVELILSKGTKVVAMPQLKGLPSLRQARLLLEQNGLEAAVEDWIFSDEPKDTVLAQTPEAGSEIARGTRVSLLSSLGPRKNAWVMRHGPSVLVCKALSTTSMSAVRTSCHVS